MFLDLKSTGADDRWLADLGRLRPWETREIANQLGRERRGASLVKSIARHVSSQFPVVENPETIEEILLIAADVQSIFGAELPAFRQSDGSGPGWLLFLKALHGSSFTELERMLPELKSSAPPNIVDKAASVISAYVKHNSIPSETLPELIGEVYNALQNANALSGTKQDPKRVRTSHQAKLKPAVPIKKSITPDYIISLEDGRKFKSLKRYLRTQYNMTPDQYRKKWGLAPDYPMIAPNYAKARSDLAKALSISGRPKRPLVGQKASGSAPRRATR
jgi:predicted transcriptional regulator